MATTTQERRNPARKPGLNVTNDADLLAKVERIRSLKTIERAAAAAERERKVLEAELRDAMGVESQVIVRGQVIASLSSLRHSTIVDQATLRDVFPEAYQAVVSQKPYQFVQVADDATIAAIIGAL